jgi:hypothetical protein
MGGSSGSGPLYTRMGGAPGVGGKAGGARESDLIDLCEIEFEAAVYAPQNTETLREGDVLSVSVGGATGRALLLTDRAGRAVGSIAGAINAGVVIKCMELGNEYSATVLRVDGGDIRIRTFRSRSAT